MQNGESFLGEKPLKIARGLNFAPKIIPDGVSGRFLPRWNEVSPCGFVEVKPGLLLGRDIMYKFNPLFLIFSLSSAFLQVGQSTGCPLCMRETTQKSLLMKAGKIVPYGNP